MRLKWKRCSSSEIILLSPWAWSWSTLPGYGFRDAGFGNRIMLAQTLRVCLLETNRTNRMDDSSDCHSKDPEALGKNARFKQHSQRSFSGVIFETGSHSVLSIARNLLCHTGCWPTGAVPVSAAWELGSQAYSTVAGSWEFSFPFCDRVLFYLPGASSIVILFSG